MPPVESITGLDEETHGLLLNVAPDGKSFSITGTPSLESFRKDGATAQSTFELTLHYSFTGIEIPSNRPVLEKKIPFVINQDPRKLWKNLPVDWDNMPEPKYTKDDTQIEYIKVEALVDGTPQKDIVAASKRGRSHAQEAKPRDDHFKMQHMDNGWYIMAVADGAGSAKFSREGSRIACEESVNYCIVQLNNNKEFENAIATYNTKAIYPLFWLAWAVCFSLRFLAKPGYYSGARSVTLILTVLGLDNFAVAAGWVGMDFACVGEWFLGSILFLYLLFPLLIRGLRRTDRKSVV